MLVILLLSTAPLDLPPQTVDRIELNHVCAVDGSIRLSQWIYWDWSPWHGCYVVRGWVMARGAMPTRIGGRWLLTIRDRDQTRTIAASCYAVSWTLYDPELENRDILPVSRR